LEELSKTAGKGIDLAGKAGGYAASVAGRTPHDLIGFLFGDRLYHWRVRQLAALQGRTERVLKERGVLETVQNPSVEIPLLEAAIDEGREELMEIWAKLWASAMDPSRKHFVRASLVDTVRKMEPIDATIFKICVDNNEIQNKGNLISFIHSLGLLFDKDETHVSIEALKSMQLLVINSSGETFLTPLGNLLSKVLW